MRYAELHPLKESVRNTINSASEEEQLAAVQQDGHAIRFIKKPSEAVQLAAVKQNGFVLDYIRNPSPAVQQAAASEAEKEVIKFLGIKNPDNKKEVLTLILQLIKFNNISKIFYYVFKYKHPDWPEWEAIDKSLRASDIIR